MIRFESRGEEVEMEIEEIAKKFIKSVYAIMPGGFVVAMIHYLDHMEESEGMKFKGLTSSDWSKLRASVIKLSELETTLV